MEALILLIFKEFIKIFEYGQEDLLLKLGKTADLFCEFYYKRRIDRSILFVPPAQQSFRAEDYICRIGGDEFTVIMVNANSSMRGLVEEKVTHINALLKIPEDGLPPISLSVGVAFGDREDSGGDIFKDADTALYRTKSARLGGVAFF